MAEIAELVEEKVKEAQANGRSHIMFVHGHSTSRPGQTTARSVVRGFMRSTPYVVKAGCIQHCTVFVAKIRPLPNLRADPKTS
jgi:hypothetical protein